MHTKQNHVHSNENNSNQNRFKCMQVLTKASQVHSNERNPNKTHSSGQLHTKQIQVHSNKNKSKQNLIKCIHIDYTMCTNQIADFYHTLKQIALHNSEFENVRSVLVCEVQTKRVQSA